MKVQRILAIDDLPELGNAQRSSPGPALFSALCPK